MPDLPADTVIVNIPIDAQSLPQYVIIRFTQASAKHNFAPHSNKWVINIFRRVFGLDYWAVIVRAGLSAMAGSRDAEYSGPDVEDLPLTDDEKARLIAGL